MRPVGLALLGVALGGLLGCEAGLPPAPPVAPSAPVAPSEELTAPLDREQGAAAPAQAVDWSGEWATTFGPLHIIQQGGSVSGEYTYENQGNSIVGHLAGTFTGRQLDFEWDEPPGGGGQGSGTFVMAEDGHSFAGTWGKGKSATDGGAWTGTR